MFTRLISKKTKIMQEFTTRNLSLELEPGWIAYRELNEVDKGYPLSFIKEKDGVGALQISFVTSEKVLDFDIKKHLRRSNINHAIGLKETKLRQWTVYEYEENKDGYYIKAFNLVKPKVIVYVTYTV